MAQSSSWSLQQGQFQERERTQQLLFTPSVQSSQEQSLEQPDPTPRVYREERRNSVLVALLQELFSHQRDISTALGHRNLLAAIHPTENNLVLSGKCLLGIPWC